jgi:hypothetical protein
MSPAGTAENAPGCNAGVPPTLKWTISATQDHVLGCSQPGLSKLADERAAGQRNLLNALKRTRTKKTGLVAVVLTLSRPYGTTRWHMLTRTPVLGLFKVASSRGNLSF